MSDTDIPVSDDTTKAVIELRHALNKVVPDGNSIELVALISALLDARIADTIVFIADRVERAIGVRP